MSIMFYSIVLLNDKNFSVVYVFVFALLDYISFVG